ncbi:MAG: phosphoglycerate kinase [Actinomycetes bacterium]|jgi:phosphoglycerate kinase|nr:MAG: phosphoglycerate kinase [Actinomycetota bacterium]
MRRYLTIDDVDVSGLRVLVRSDLNVPLEDGRVADDFRIRMALPTLEELVRRGATVTVCSHLGRPKGVDPAFTLRPVAGRMAELASVPVSFDAPVEGGITVLENTRFLDGETKNDPDTAAKLAEGQDLFVQDAFGSVHRAHASTVGVAEILKSVAGPLLDAELKALGRLLEDPDRPYVVVLGGAKVSDKLAVIENLLPRVDRMLVGGGMCFTFLKAQGKAVGSSLIEEDMVETVGRLMGEYDGKIVLPTDFVVADRFAADADSKVVGVDGIEDGWMGLDIGPETAASFASVVKEAASVFWNGPMGVFEWDRFRSGTEAVARAMAESEGFTAIGGGDSAAAIRALGLDGAVTHVSTGGGAGLELLEGRELPGVAVLERWVS